ncbi:MAG: hypothetical protein LW636_07005 [Planctomycetaceae bacterium]|nr:hypothetical protein [Planctomycetaceae bacterium]
MGLASFIRSMIGAAPQSEADAAGVAAQGAADARAAATEMKALVAQVRSEHTESIERVGGELARLSARVDAMPEMRAQLESFVQSLGRTMTGAADRLETVDDRIHHLEQQARSQTEIIALMRTEFDRQGRSVASLDEQLRTLRESIDRLAVAAERTEALVREFEERKVRSNAAAWTAIAAAGVSVVALLYALLR